MKKILFIASCIIVGIGAFFLISGEVEYHKFAKIERAEKEAKAQRADSLISQADSLERIGNKYSMSDSRTVAAYSHAYRNLSEAMMLGADVDTVQMNRISTSIQIIQHANYLKQIMAGGTSSTSSASSSARMDLLYYFPL